MTESKYAWIVEEAKKDFAAGMNWVDFSNKYFSRGSRFLPATAAERREYVHTPEYKEVQNWKHALEWDQEGIGEQLKAEADLANYTGKIFIRIPRSLHKSLSLEADREGTSLNQLILAKLSIPLHTRLMGDGK